LFQLKINNIMTKGFAEQPIGGGFGNLLETKNSKNTDMTASSIGFTPAPLFANANGGIFSPIKGKVFTNADGDVPGIEDGSGYNSGNSGSDDKPSFFEDMFGTGISFGDATKQVLGYLNSNAQAQRDAAARGDAITLEKLKLQEAQLKLDLAKAEAANPKNGKTSIVVPILVTGGVIILGIASYFIFRKIGK